MKRLIIKMQLRPGSAMANSPWLPPECDGVIAFDQISFAAVMTCLGEPMTIDEATVTISKAPHSEEDPNETSTSVYYNSKDLLGLP